MEVTKSNFNEVLPKVKKSIDDSCFLAIDCEMTGLDSGAKINIFDTHKSYYEKIKRGSQNFIIVQFGLAAFAFDHENQVFKPSYYNFYIFPRQHDRSSPDRRFLCQASSIDFLVGNNFDFNKLFKEGISYLNKDEENRCLDILVDKQKLRATQNTAVKSNTNPISVPEEDKEFIDKNM